MMLNALDAPRRELAEIDHVLLWTVLILLLIFMFWWVLPIMLLGLFLGFRYSFRGHQITGTVNKAMDKAAQTAEQIKSNIHTEAHHHEE